MQKELRSLLYTEAKEKKKNIKTRASESLINGRISAQRKTLCPCEAASTKSCKVVKRWLVGVYGVG